MKEKYFKDLGLDDDNEKVKKLENEYNLDELFNDNKENIENKKDESKEN
ncbi:MAG: hypothetical protein J6D03_02330 [Clostridia bacterium]|nr:hypothetical protein [Clostridia bacterium]